MVKLITISYKILHRERVKLFYILAITTFLYGFLIQKAIMNIVAREKVVNDVATLTAEIADLEEQYLSLKNNITLDTAYEKGLQDAVVSYYISKKSITAMASKNEL